MTEQEVIEKIKYMQKYQTETDQLEAKTAKIDFPKKCYDTISAFSNKCGGIIIFGLNENNNFIEQDVYDVNDLQKQILWNPKYAQNFYQLCITKKSYWQ